MTSNAERKVNNTIKQCIHLLRISFIITFSTDYLLSSHVPGFQSFFASFCNGQISMIIFPINQKNITSIAISINQ